MIRERIVRRQEPVNLIRYKWTKRVAILLALLGLLSSGVVGCAHIGNFTKGIGSLTSSRRTAELQVTPLSNQDVITLSADDVIRIMRRAGFSDEQILRLGTDVRSALLLSGAAQVRLRDKVEVIFAVHDDYVFITTRLRGHFIYDVKAGGFGLRTASPEQ
jgi:hypothetical protein